jgi:hypothetical protein
MLYSAGFSVRLFQPRLFLPQKIQKKAGSLSGIFSVILKQKTVQPPFPVSESTLADLLINLLMTDVTSRGNVFHYEPYKYI